MAIFPLTYTAFFDIPPTYFTFVREPVARVRSLYVQLSKPESPYFTRIQDGLSLKDMTITRVTEMTNNHMTQVISGFRPEPGELMVERMHLERANAFIRQYFFFVGVVETSQQDYDTLASRLSWR